VLALHGGGFAQDDEGGGGGAGYYGGGGASVGGNGAGGGGGSDFCTNTATITMCAVTSGAGTQTGAGSAAGDAQVMLTYTQPFAGTPGAAKCSGQTVSALSQQFGSLDAAAAALGFPSVKALQTAIKSLCAG